MRDFSEPPGLANTSTTSWFARVMLFASSTSVTAPGAASGTALAGGAGAGATSDAWPEVVNSIVKAQATRARQQLAGRQCIDSPSLRLPNVMNASTMIPARTHTHTAHARAHPTL